MLTPLPTDTGYCGPAEVLELTNSTAALRLPNQFEAVSAIIATRERFGVGDQVLVTGQDTDALYVTSVMPGDSTERRVSTSSGAYAVVSGSPTAERLQVYGTAGQLLVEIDVQTNRARIAVDSGDLELTAPQGSVSFAAGKRIRLAAETVEVHAMRSLCGTVGTSESESTSLRLDSQNAHLRSRMLRVEHESVEVRAEKTQYSGKSFSLAVSTLRCVSSRFENIAETVVERARQAFRTVKGLAQIRAGRIRQMADTTWQVKSQKANLSSNDEFKVQGRKIHLG